MTLNEKIMQIYSSITPDDFNPVSGTILLQDDSDGKGPYIKSWTNPNPKPNEDQLNSIS